MDNTILEMRNITKTFPGVKALENVNLKVRQGEIHALVGENGAGKSTLMKVLSGVYPAGSYEGEIYYDGQARNFKLINDSEEIGIIIIHQELALEPLLSIAENIELDMRHQAARHPAPDCVSHRFLLHQAGGQRVDHDPKCRVAVAPHVLVRSRPAY